MSFQRKRPADDDQLGRAHKALKQEVTLQGLSVSDAAAEYIKLEPTLPGHRTVDDYESGPRYRVASDTDRYELYITPSFTTELRNRLKSLAERQKKASSLRYRRAVAAQKEAKLKLARHQRNRHNYNGLSLNDFARTSKMPLVIYHDAEMLLKERVRDADHAVREAEWVAAAENAVVPRCYRIGCGCWEPERMAGVGEPVKVDWLEHEDWEDGELAG